MNSSKQSTQRRMLSPKNTANSPRFAKLAGRSPNGKLQTKKPQTRTSLGSLQTLKDSDSSTSLNKVTQNRQKIPQRVIQNVQQTTIQFQNRDRYEGGVKDDQMYGHGTYYFYSQNLKYVGQFYNNQFHGWGSISKNYGNESPIYEGNFEHGKKHGEGKYQYGPHHYFNGNWKYDLKDGKGIYQYHQGLYNGQWSQNKKSGEGTLKLTDGTQYKGQFQNDYFISGLVRYPNGDEYSGEMNQGKRDGFGSYFSFNSQQRYKGHWKNNKKHGRGTIFLQNGDQLQCTFQNGQIDQSQSCTYKWATGQFAGSIFNGWFKNGSPEKGHVTGKDGAQYDTY